MKITITSSRYDMNERKIGMGIQILMIIGFLIIIGIQYSEVPQYLTLFRVASLCIISLILFLYLRQVSYAPILLVLFGSLAVALSVKESSFNISNPYMLLMASLVALVLTSPRWVFVTGILSPLFFFMRPGTFVRDVPITFWILYGMIIGSLILVRMLTDSVIMQTRKAALVTEEARAELERHSLALTQANSKQQEQLQEQQRLLALVNTLEIPVVQIAHAALLVPIVGHMDQARTQRITERILHDIHRQRIRLAILDISGVSMVDTGVAKALMEMAHAIRLLGCNVAFSGITTQFAITMTQLGIDMHEVVTVPSPQAALELLRPLAAQH